MVLQPQTQEPICLECEIRNREIKHDELESTWSSHRYTTLLQKQGTVDKVQGDKGYKETQNAIRMLNVKLIILKGRVIGKKNMSS